MPTNPSALVILDGFGHSTNTESNAIFHAHKPTIDYFEQHFPHTLLRADGSYVGLLPGMIGNSQVGHLTLGAGRIIPQAVLLIHHMIDDGSFAKFHLLQKSMEQIKRAGSRLHLMGLLSDAGVHSHEKHLYALLDIAHQASLQVFVHAFLDGRDVPPQSAQLYLERLSKYCYEHPNTHIGSIHGRFYAMDRDKNWERTQVSYDVLTEEQPIIYKSWQAVLDHYYSQRIFDEFIPPTPLDAHAIVRNDDGIIFFNVRPDRARQLTACFMCPERVPFKVKDIRLLFFLTMADYNQSCGHVQALLAKPEITETFKDILAAHHKSLFCIAETEKYAHVTYFFGGGREAPLSSETWKLIPSIPAKDYVHNPQMSAAPITDAVLTSLKEHPYDFYLINYANADMVGHSGNFEATKKAIEILDHELQRLYETIVKKMNGTLYITADHGNAEQKQNMQTGQSQTAHTTNPVPFFMIRQDLFDKKYQLPLHELADVAPFILQQMNIEPPAIMKKVG